MQNNYQLIKLNIPEGNFEQLKLVSNAFFQLYEIAAVAELPKEYVALDLGEEKTIGEIKVRHWTGNNTTLATELYVSSDSIHWTFIQNLDPNDLSVQNIVLPDPINAQYIKVEQTLKALMMEWRVLTLSFTPKFHMLLNHCVEALKRMNGFSDMGEDRCERAHQDRAKQTTGNDVAGKDAGTKKCFCFAGNPTGSGDGTAAKTKRRRTLVQTTCQRKTI